MTTVERVRDSERLKRGFVALVLAGDNSERAAEACGIPSVVLRKWRRSFPEEYERVRLELAPRLESMLLEDTRATIVQLGRVERLALEKLEEALEAGEIPKRDLPGALRNISTSKAINVDKAQLLSGRPTSIVADRSIPELLRRLERLGAAVDGSAVEVPAGGLGDGSSS